MIKLSFKSPHRSISQLPNLELPDFAVITGVNGSGKSHLLGAIKVGAIEVEGVAPNTNHVRVFDWTNLIPSNPTVSPPSSRSSAKRTSQNPDAADPLEISNARTNFIQKVSRAFSQHREEFLKQVSSLKAPFFDGLEMDALARLTPQTAQALKENDKRAANTWITFLHLRTALDQACMNAISGDRVIHEILAARAEKKGSCIASLTYRDLYEAIPLNWRSTDLFQQNFSRIFAAYYRALEENQYHDFINRVRGANEISLSDPEFISVFGDPPWNFVNRLLEEAHLDYRINSPTGRADVPFEARLINKTTNANVAFHDLSSGEKIIMSLAVILHNATDRMCRINAPKLLLLDEVDAPLHPSMTRDLIRVIDKVLVKEQGIKVILTTHSPATVAFCPDGALFRLDRSPRSIVRCTREQAIQTLTSGYISVTDGSRFIITEARQDRIVYSAMVRKLVDRGNLPSFPNLVFVQASDEKDRTGGGRDQVKNWGNKFPAVGLNQIFGLIDKDSGNTASRNVKVIGRYSFENYLLDPIILYAVLMHRGEHSKVLDAGLKDGNYYLLREADSGTLQKISDKIRLLVESNQPAVKSFMGSFEVKYVSGKSISAPLWLQDYPSHDLIEAVRETFKSVVAPGFVITRNDCEDLTQMLTERLPEFFPEELVQVFRDLQTA